MENASKALLLAGGVLIALLIFAVGGYLALSSSQISGSYDKKLSADEIRKFNSNFTKFEGREDISAQEIVTIANFVQQYNQENDMNFKVVVTGVSAASKLPEQKVLTTKAQKNTYKNNIIKFLEQNSTKISAGTVKIVRFSCEKITYRNNDTSDIIEKIEFKKIP